MGGLFTRTELLSFKILSRDHLATTRGPVSYRIRFITNLSHFANSVYDQLWYKRGSPRNIYILNIELGTENSENLKKVIFGSSLNTYNGVNLNGEGASRHLSYRSIQAIKPIITQSRRSENKEARPENYNEICSNINEPRAKVQNYHEKRIIYNIYKITLKLN